MVEVTVDSGDRQRITNGNQTSGAKSMRSRRHESSFPQLPGNKNSFAFQSREPAFGPREKNLRIRE